MYIKQVLVSVVLLSLVIAVGVYWYTGAHMIKNEPIFTLPVAKQYGPSGLDPSLDLQQVMQRIDPQITADVEDWLEQSEVHVSKQYENLQKKSQMFAMAPNRIRAERQFEIFKRLDVTRHLLQRYLGEGEGFSQPKKRAFEGVIEDRLNEHLDKKELTVLSYLEMSDAYVQGMAQSREEYERRVIEKRAAFIHNFPQYAYLYDVHPDEP